MAKFNSIKPSPDAPNAPSEETVVASNPFDDPPSAGNRQAPNCSPMLMSSFMHPNHMHLMHRPFYMPRPSTPYGHLPLHHHLSGPMPAMMEQRIYPIEQAMIRSTNPNAPPIYICRCCRLEIHDNEQTVYCGSECKRFFHRNCVGMTEDAWNLMNNEPFAEWICDHCFVKRGRPMINLPPGHQQTAP